MGYFRAVLQSQEKSPRALQLCAEVTMLNPANYIAWAYRREVFLDLLPKNCNVLNFITTVADVRLRLCACACVWRLCSRM